MCGIAGFVGSFDQSLLKKMNNAITHRGPDDDGIYWVREKGIGLAHRRLSIIDISPLGHQPMVDRTGTVVIVFNGEIFNYLELRDELIQKGYRFKGRSDTEVLLNLYLDHKEKMLSRLNGMFAFAVWDSRIDSLFLARDGVGVKPLYYSETPKGFLFASELKAILQEPGIDRTLDDKSIYYYLRYLWCPAPHTMLKEVRKLEPGHAMIVKDGRIQQRWQFYDLPYDQPITPVSEGEAVSQAQEYLKKAIERQMVADVPVGTFLSGGLDSSAVTAFARQVNPHQKMCCFTIGIKDGSSYDEKMADDLPYAERVAKHLGVDLHTIYVGPEMVEELEGMIYHLDEPQADPSPINVFYISKLARRHGIKVLLSGAGGDDIFTGYRRHYSLMQEKYWGWMPRATRRGLRFLSHIIPKDNIFGRRVSKAFQYADLDGDERIASYFYWTDPGIQPGLGAPSLREGFEKASPADPLIASLQCLPRNMSPLNRMLYLEGKYFLADHNLNYTDKMSMAVGVEVRVPLLDPDLISFAARLPVSFKQRGTVGKWIFKRAMEPYLPYDIIYRPKVGFGAPMRHWLQHELRPIVEEVLSNTSLTKRGLFDSKAVQQLIDLDHKGKVNGAYTIFSLMCIELWCRIFIDHTVPVKRGMGQ